MKTIVVYEDDTESARDVNEYLRDFSRQTGHQLETLDPRTKEGTDFCRAYDIVEYPSLVAISDDGVMQNLWRGLPLPTISEVSYYV
ncbi:MAG TPA: hypothetical protein VLG36_01380 [Candidatus Chromulinivoraceae bacterium]|nr:hypothetical protein [Candidatus Chromulinivoraceae bacterium]